MSSSKETKLTQNQDPNFIFEKQKSQVLSAHDLSRKGSIDAPIHDLIQHLNHHSDFVTLSSCSGRILVFSNKDVAKKGCEWILVSHEHVETDQIWSSIRSDRPRSTLKVEPFILHVQCRNVEAARKLHHCAVESGFRESGITISKASKVVLAVRSSPCLQVPLSDDNGKILIDKNYVEYITELANEKMRENFKRHSLFYAKIKEIHWETDVEDKTNNNKNTSKNHQIIVDAVEELLDIDESKFEIGDA